MAITHVAVEPSDQFNAVDGNTVTVVRAIAVALAYSIRDKEPSLAVMIWPSKVRLSWARLPPWVQDRFYAICKDLGVNGDKPTYEVRNALFRNAASFATSR